MPCRLAYCLGLYPLRTTFPSMFGFPSIIPLFRNSLALTGQSSSNEARSNRNSNDFSLLTTSEGRNTKASCLCPSYGLAVGGTAEVTFSDTGIEAEGFIHLGASSPKFKDSMFLSHNDLVGLLQIYPNVHELPSYSLFHEMCIYLGWDCPSHRILRDSIKWALIMKIRGTIEKHLLDLG